MGRSRGRRSIEDGPHGNITELLRAEQEFASKRPEVFDRFTPDLLEAFDEALGMYTTFGRAIGQSPATDNRFRAFNDRAKALGAVAGADSARMRKAAAGDLEKQALLDELQEAEDRIDAGLDGALRGDRHSNSREATGAQTSLCADQ